MRPIGELLADLNHRGLKLWAENGSLRYSAPKAALTEELREVLRTRKAEILAVLRQVQQSTAVPPLAPIPHVDKLPLSFGQESLWFLDQLQERLTAHNIAVAVRLSGVLKVAALEQSLSELVRRQASLRTNFVIAGGQPTAVIHAAAGVNLPVVNLEQLAPAEQESAMRRLAHEQAGEPFDLARDRLWRVSLLRLGAQAHVLLLVVHHIVFDGWSAGVFVQELAALYQALVEGKPAPLPELPIEYVDFAHWQRQCLQGDMLQRLLDYWKQQLGGAPPVLPLPTDYPRPPTQTFRGRTVPFTIPAALTQQLNQLAVASGKTLFMVLLAAFQILLWRYCAPGGHPEDVVVGTPFANRTRRETESLIGFFVNTLVLRTNLAGNPTVRELLERVSQVTRGAYEHQDLPFEKLVEELQPDRNLSYNPLFQVMFALQSNLLEAVELPELTLTPLTLDHETAQFDLALALEETAQGLAGALEYSTALFAPATIERMSGHYQTLLAGLVANPAQRISELPLLTAAERQQLLVEWNQTQATYPADKCVHKLFEEQVQRTPEAVAVVFEDEHVTYVELNRRANQLAHYLQTLGVGPDSLVGLCVERSPEMLVGLLGILKAGGAYLPLDPTYPQERLAFMLEDAQPRVVIAQSHLVETLLSVTPSHKVVCLDTDWPIISRESRENPTSSVAPDNLAYVIYTSGSTGKPKGVLLAHQGLCNLTQAEIQRFAIQPASRILQLVSFSFDVATSDWAMTLCAGAKLYLASSEALLPGPNLIQLLRNSGITHMEIPTSVLTALPFAELPALQTLIVGGEACSLELAARWAHGRNFFNVYGPTEATVCATTAEISTDGCKPPIGRPLANTQVYVLDRHGQPVPIGVAGELHIGGVGVARGYLNRPELTAEKFIPNPFGAGRLYKTGDLVRYRPDGNLEFLGRLDDQVKLRGFRIELGEIEATLNQHPAVEQSVVFIRRDAASEPRLVAYLVARAEADTSIEHTADSLRILLKQRLPAYMVPTAFVWLEQFPVTPNGKIDRKALPAPAQQPLAPLATAMLPQTEAEQHIAAIWRELLHLAQVGIHANFFDLGGHSLLLVQAQSRLQAAFGRDLSMVELFTYPTIHTLARYLSQEHMLPAHPHLQRRADVRSTRRTAMHRQQAIRLDHRAKSFQEGELQ